MQNLSFSQKKHNLFGQFKKKLYLCTLFRLLGSQVALLRGRMIPIGYGNVDDLVSRLTDVTY